MPINREFYDEWLKSPWSTAENYMPYEEYASLRIRREANQSYKAATIALKDATKLRKQADKAAKRAK
jgi:hypothetical protein